MSSVSICASIRVARNASVRQYPLEPQNRPNPNSPARPGWLTP